MKKLFAIVAMLGVFSFGSTAMAQEAEVASVEGQSIHKVWLSALSVSFI